MERWWTWLLVAIGTLVSTRQKAGVFECLSRMVRMVYRILTISPGFMTPAYHAAQAAF